MAYGDVLRVELPTPSGGVARHEQSGRRPAIAVQSDVHTARLPTVMVIPLTSQLEALRFPYTVRIEPTPTNGLTQISVLLVFQLRAIDRRAVLGRLGSLEAEVLTQLAEQMRQLLRL